jgi:hypothetical protein
MMNQATARVSALRAAIAHCSPPVDTLARIRLRILRVLQTDCPEFTLQIVRIISGLSQTRLTSPRPMELIRRVSQTVRKRTTSCHQDARRVRDSDCRALVAHKLDWSMSLARSVTAISRAISLGTSNFLGVQSDPNRAWFSELTLTCAQKPFDVDDLKFGPISWMVEREKDTLTYSWYVFDLIYGNCPN